MGTLTTTGVPPTSEPSENDTTATLLVGVAGPLSSGIVTKFIRKCMNANFRRSFSFLYHVRRQSFRLNLTKLLMA